MSGSERFGSLEDFLPAKEEPCPVHGCHNKVSISGDMAMRNIAHGKSGRVFRLCDECYALLQTLQDQELPCSRPGCDGKWIYSRYKQLDAIRSGHDKRKPHGLCDKCRKEMQSVEAEQYPCRLHGCKNTWTLTAREKLELGDKPVPHRLCDECFKTLNTLQDKEMPCRVHGCDHTWTWNRYQQLEHLKAGKKLEMPPQRMCPECFAEFQKLQNVEIPCRIHGCTHTWTWTTYDQLEQMVKLKKEGLYPPAEKTTADAEVSPEAGVVSATASSAIAQTAEVTVAPESPVSSEAPVSSEPTAVSEAPKAPEVPKYPAGLTPPGRMCRDCYTFWSTAKDIEVPCRIHGCTNTWTWNRSMQLGQRVRGKEGIPSRFCAECGKKIVEMTDKTLTCMTEGCEEQIPYPREEQLRDQMSKREPKPRHCQKCSEFLKAHPAKDVPCEECGKMISVTSAQQLMVEKGVLKMPRICSDCAQKKLNEKLTAPQSSAGQEANSATP